MTRVRGLVRTLSAVVTFALAGSLSGTSTAASPEEATSTRLNVLTFNACDQFGILTANVNCRESDYLERALNIIDRINVEDVEVVALQEVCRTTFNRVMDGLNVLWDGEFYRTVDTGDTRCGTGANDDWGLAILALGGIPAGTVTANWIGYDAGGEVRRLLCGNTTIVLGFKVCSTHLANPDSTADADANREQFARMRGLINGFAGDDAAVILGADLNRDALDCAAMPTVYMLSTVYRGIFGDGTANGCGVGAGQFYEADHAASGLSPFDEPTMGSRKIDYVFVNYLRFYADYTGNVTYSAVSDHRPLYGFVTVHD